MILALFISLLLIITAVAFHPKSFILHLYTIVVYSILHESPIGE